MGLYVLLLSLAVVDGVYCQQDYEYDSFLMYSRVVRIDSVNISDEHNLNAPYPSIQSKELMRNAIGLTYDYSRLTLFYSDIEQGSINAVLFNGSNHRVIVERQGSVEGLSHEAVENMLYWTCINNATINRVNLSADSMKPETIIKLGPNDKPRGIAVDSCDRRMYWTNWNSHHPCIQRAYLTGDSQEAIIISTDIRIPNALTLDYQTQKLYWGDARLDKIERCEYDGTNRVVLAKLTPKHLFGMAVHGDLLFWTDWIQHAVIRANKYTGDDVVWLRKDVRPMGIVAIADNTKDCFNNPCKIQNGGCEDTCKLTAEGRVYCTCFENRSLQPDKKRCVTTAAPNCTQEEFQCSDRGCIPYHLTCDGVPHCIDLSDEDETYCIPKKKGSGKVIKGEDREEVKKQKDQL